MNDTIAVTDAMAGAAGRIVYWRLTGEVDYDALTELWEASNLSSLLIPSPTSAKRALRLSMDEQRDCDLLVRSLPDGGCALVREWHANGHLRYTELLHASLAEEDGVPVLMIEVLDPSAASLEDKIVEEYERRLDTLDSQAVSSWLTIKILPSIKALSLRDRGGVYFIPAGIELDKWTEFVEILRRCSQHTMFQIPAMRSDDAVHAILDALNAEAGEALDKLEAELGFGVEEAEELGERAIATRTTNMEALLEKLTAYEELLDTRLDSIRDRVGNAQATLATLALSQGDD